MPDLEEFLLFFQDVRLDSSKLSRFCIGENDNSPLGLQEIVSRTYTGFMLL